MSDPDRKAYIGFKPCGCCTFAMVSGYSTPKQEQRELEKQIKQGMRIEVMHPDVARQLPNFLCECSHGNDSVDPKADAAKLVADVRGSE